MPPTCLGRGSQDLNTSPKSSWTLIFIIMADFEIDYGREASGSGQASLTKRAHRSVAFIRFGDTQPPKPYESIWFGDAQPPTPYEFIWFGDTQGPKTL